jgi:hypothetical protein
MESHEVGPVPGGRYKFGGKVWRGILFQSHKVQLAYLRPKYRID